MGLCAYNTSKPKKRFLMIISFYIINLCFIGSLAVFKINKIWFLLVTLVYTIILIVLEKVIYKNLKIKNGYLVNINNQDLKALLDTGNNCCYKSKPVVFLDLKYLDNSYKKIGFKIIKTINHQELVEVYSGPKILFDEIEYDVVYSFSKIEDYDIILNSVMGEWKWLNY